MTDILLADHQLFPSCRKLLSAGSLVKATFPDRVKAAQGAGFDAISLFPQQYLHALKKEKLSISDMQEILAEHDVSIDEVDPLLDWFGTGASESEHLMYEMADAFSARSMNAAPAFHPAIDVAEITEAYAGLCERAAAHNLRVDLEFLPWTRVPNFQTALKIVEDTGLNNAGVMFDCWHFFRSNGQVEEIKQLSPQAIAKITSIQLNDAPNQAATPGFKQNLASKKEMLLSALDARKVIGKNFFKIAASAENPHPDAQQMMSEASFFRLFPGEGDIPLKALLNALHDAGCKPVVGMEVFAIDYFKQPASEVAKRLMDAYKSVAVVG